MDWEELYISIDICTEQDDEFVIITMNGTISGEFDTITTPSVSSGSAWYMEFIYDRCNPSSGDSSPEISIGDREYRATEDEQLI